MADWISAHDLNNLVKPGDCIYVGGSTNEPHGLLDSLASFSSGYHFLQQPIAAVNRRDLSDIGEGSTETTFFMTPFLKGGLKRNTVKFVPMQMRAIYDYITILDIDVALLLAAKASSGGRSIVALSATAKNVTVSRIVPKVEMVTALRTDVDIVVTEFGVARLKNASLSERFDALIRIAHPNFRDQLRVTSLKD